MRLLLGAYRMALVVLPPSFRRDWGEAMVSEASDSLREARGTLELVRVVGRIARDLAATWVREWRATTADAWTGLVAAGLRGDLRSALRSLRRTPLVSGLVVVTLGLGIGANTAIFSVVNAVLLRPLPYPEPDELVAVWPGKLFSLSLYDAARADMHAIEDIALYGGEVMTLSDGVATEVFGGQVTANYFDLMGVAPALGRGFRPEDGRPGAAPVVLLGHDLWSGRYAADPDIVGRSIALQHEDESRRTVVGVMRPGYRDLLDGAEAWIPITQDPSSDTYSSSSFAQAVGRLAPDAPLAEGRAELRAVAQRMLEESPGMYAEAEVRGATVVPMMDHLVGTLRTNLLALLAAVGLVLLTACANVANLLLARGASRGREMGVRTALGAGRATLLRQHLVESLILGLSGGAAGLGVAWLTRDLLVGSLPSGFRVEDAGVDPTVLLFTMAVAVGASLLFGLAPGWRASNVSPAGALAGGRGTEGGHTEARLQSVLVAGQVSLALVAVFAAGLLVRSVQEVTSVDPGFEPEGLLTFRVTATPEAFPDDADVARYVRDVERAIGDVPGVLSTGAVGRLPLAGGTSRVTIFPEGFEPGPSGELPDATHRLVTHGYAEAMGFRLVEGAWPTREAFEDGPLVGYVTRGMADRYFPDGAVGKRFFGPGGVVWVTVGAVIEDVREDGLQGPVLPGLYIPHRDWPWRTMSFVVRTRDEPMEALPAVREAVWSVSASVPVSRVRTMEDVILRSVEGPRLTGRLFSLFGVLALALGAVGVYGVTAWSLGRRRQEFGIRIALGASRAAVVRRALRQGVRALVIGLVAGVALTAPTGRLLAGSVEGVRAFSPEVLGGAAVVLALVVLLAALVPAHRETRIDPADPLRQP